MSAERETATPSCRARLSAVAKDAGGGHNPLQVSRTFQPGETSMKSSSVCRAVARICCAVVAVLPLAAGAQQYPTRPLLIVAPFGAGGDSDIAARNLAAVIPKYLKQNAVVLNKVGASGAIGSEYVKNAAPDGYTFLLARVGSQATLPALKPDLSYKWCRWPTCRLPFPARPWERSRTPVAPSRSRPCPREIR